MANEAGSSDGPEPAVSSPHRRWFLIAAIAFLVWFVLLISIALWLANPITFNRAQLLQSKSIVAAQVRRITPQPGGTIACELNVIETLHGTAPDDPVILVSLPAGSVPDVDSQVIAPLSRLAGRWDVTRAVLPKPSKEEEPPSTPPILYLLTDESRQALKDVLAEMKR